MMTEPLLKELVRFITYDGLFENCSLINYPIIEEAIKLMPYYKEHCHIDEHKVLWTIDGWISECKRINALNDTIAKHRLAKDNDPAILRQRIIQLGFDGKFDEVKELQKKLRALTQGK